MLQLGCCLLTPAILLTAFVSIPLQPAHAHEAAKSACRLIQRLQWASAHPSPVLSAVQVHAAFAQNLRRQLQCRILQSARNPDECRWLPGARLNIAESALSARDPDAPAVVWAEEGHPQCVHSLTLGQLRRRSVRVAVALKAAGIQPGECG